MSRFHQNMRKLEVELRGRTKRSPKPRGKSDVTPTSWAYEAPAGLKEDAAPDAPYEGPSAQEIGARSPPAPPSAAESAPARRLGPPQREQWAPEDWRALSDGQPADDPLANIRARTAQIEAGRQSDRPAWEAAAGRVLPEETMPAPDARAQTYYDSHLPLIVEGPLRGAGEALALYGDLLAWPTLEAMNAVGAVDEPLRPILRDTRQRMSDRTEFLGRFARGLGDAVGNMPIGEDTSIAGRERQAAEQERNFQRNIRLNDYAEQIRRPDRYLGTSEPLDVTVQGPSTGERVGRFIDDTVGYGATEDFLRAEAQYQRADFLADVARERENARRLGVAPENMPDTSMAPLPSDQYESQAEAASVPVGLTIGLSALEFVPGVGLVPDLAAAGRATARGVGRDAWRLGQRVGVLDATDELPYAFVAREGAEDAPGLLTRQYRDRIRNPVIAAGVTGAGVEAADGNFGDDPLASTIAAGSAAALTRRLGATAAEAGAERVVANRLREGSGVEPINADFFPTSEPAEMSVREYRPAENTVVRVEPDGRVVMTYQGAYQSGASDARAAGSGAEAVRTWRATLRALEDDIAATQRPEYHWTPGPDGAPDERLANFYREAMSRRAPEGYVFSETPDGVMHLTRERPVRFGEELDVRTGEIRPATPIDINAPDLRLADDLGLGNYPRRDPTPQSESSSGIPPRRLGASDPPDAGNGGAGQWVDLYHGSNQEPGPWRGSLWATPEQRAANDYAQNFRKGGQPNVRRLQGNTEGAVTMRDERDLYDALGPEQRIVDPIDGLPHLRNVGSEHFWELLDDPAVQDALRRRGVHVVHLENDYGPSSVSGRGGHQSYLFLNEDKVRDFRTQSPDGGARGGEQFDTSRVVYRGLGRQYDPANGGYYQSFTSSLDDAREYGSNVVAAHIRPGRNLAVDGGGRNFNVLGVEQLPADVRARLHPSVGETATTDQIAHAAREAGYDSVTVRNVHDNRWGERPIAGAEPRTIDFVFNTENIRPLDGIPPQATGTPAGGEKVRLSAADRALLDELLGPDARNLAAQASRRRKDDPLAAVALATGATGAGIAVSDDASADDMTAAEALNAYGASDTDADWQIVSPRGDRIPSLIGARQVGRADGEYLTLETADGRRFRMHVMRGFDTDANQPGLSMSVVGELVPRQPQTSRRLGQDEPREQGDPWPLLRLMGSSVAGIAAGSSIRHPTLGAVAAGASAFGADRLLGGAEGEAFLSGSAATGGRALWPRVAAQAGEELAARGPEFEARRRAFALTLPEERPELRGTQVRGDEYLGTRGSIETDQMIERPWQEPAAARVIVPGQEMAEQGYSRRLGVNASPREQFEALSPTGQLRWMNEAERKMAEREARLVERLPPQRRRGGPETPAQALPRSENAFPVGFYDPTTGQPLFGSSGRQPPPRRERLPVDQLKNPAARIGATAADRIALARELGVVAEGERVTGAEAVKRLMERARSDRAFQALLRERLPAIAMALLGGAAGSEIISQQRRLGQNQEAMAR